MKKSLLKKIVVLIVVILFGVLFVSTSSCKETEITTEPAIEETTEGEVETTTEETATPEKKFKIAYLCPDLENPAWKLVSDGVTVGGADLGLDTKALTASGDANNQMKNAQDLITQQYDGIVLSGTDSTSVPAVLDLCAEADMPVVLLFVASSDPSLPYLSLVVPEEEKGGYETGKVMAEYINAEGLEGRTAEISITLARSNGIARDAGFQQAMKEAGIEVAEVKEAIKYTRDEAYKFTQDLITTYPDLVGIFCNYDEAALGAMKAILDNDLKDQIVLGGYDGSKESIQAIKDGNMDCMGVIPLYGLGQNCAQIFYDYFTIGEEPEKEILLPMIEMTKDNIAQTEVEALEGIYGTQ